MKIVQLEWENVYHNYLFQLLAGMKLSDYYFEILEDDITHFVRQEEKSGLFDSRIVDSETFFDMVKNNTYYIFFTTIKAYRKGVRTDEFPLRTAADVSKSNCDFLINCYDCCYATVFINRESLANSIMHNCTQISHTVRVKALKEMEFFRFC